MSARGEGARGVKGLWWNEGEDCWHYDFRVSGHRFRGSCRTKARREAERHVQELRRQAAASLRESAGLEPMSFETASSRWWLEKGQHRARPHEIERDLAWLQTAIGARTLIRSIDANEITRLVSVRRAEGVSTATVNRTVTEHLRAILRRAAVWGQPVKPVDWSALLLTEKAPRPRPASRDEEARLLAEVREDYRPIVRFALLSGLRLEELVSLRRTQITFGREPSLRLIGKGDKLRVIPLTTAMAALLRHELERHALPNVWTYEAIRRRRGERPKTGRQPITISGLKSEWRRARARAGFVSTREDPVSGLRWHDLRATAVTRVGHEGGVAAAQLLAGHSEIATTMRYFKQGEAALRQAMERAESSHETSQSPDRTAENAKDSSKIR